MKDWQSPKEKLAAALAPAAPPCFATRDVWVSYVASAAVEQRLPSMPGPFRYVRIVDISAEPAPGTVIENGMAVSFDPDFRYCGDCEFRFRDRMQQADRCRPDHLKEKT